MTNATSGLLTVRGLELKVNLGWRDKELMDPQSVMLDFEVSFYTAPKACTTDHLADTLCYAVIIEDIRTHLNNKKYRLIEHLSQDIQQRIIPYLPAFAHLRVTVTKKPKIEGLVGGVSYSCFYDNNKGS